MLNMNKVAVSSYTAGLGDLGASTATSSVGIIALGASASTTITLSLAIKKTEALANVRINFAGITFSNFGNYYWLVPESVTLLDASSKTFQIRTNYKRTANLLTITVTYNAGSGGCTIPAHTVSATSHFYQLPF